MSRVQAKKAKTNAGKRYFRESGLSGCVTISTNRPRL